MMFFKKNTTVALVGYALAAMSFVASAQTLRISNQGDATSMDPHSLNESMQLSITGNVYEGLVGRNKDLSLAPALGDQMVAAIAQRVAL
jgi:peptide/nickel transport system substrate-binding protein